MPEAPPHVCKRKHTELVGNTTAVDELMTLPPSQRNPWRHICAACAFEKGFSAGLEHALDMVQDISDKLQKAHTAVQKSRRQA